MSDKNKENNINDKKQEEKVIEKKLNDNEIEKQNDESGIEKTFENNSVTQDLETEENKVLTRPGQWMLRPCEWYKDEYDECTCMKARFNQYFVHGEYLDCTQWKKDYQNCKKWKKSDDDTAYNALLASEKQRRIARLKPHFANDVWTKRDKPPENWNTPLPEWLKKREENTFLDYKQKALESGNVNDIDMKIPFCTIM